MGILNNLRKRIVQKLIRPEDGYTFTGFNEGQPLKFYYQEDTGKYLLGLRSDNWYYFSPSLSGWHSYASKHLPWGTATYGKEPQEVDFQKWIHGILENVYEEYSERISNLSNKEIKQLTKRNTGEKLMISKQSFCDIMETLDKYWGELRSLEQVLDVVFEDNMLTKIFDGVLNALEEDLEPDLDMYDMPMLYTWMFDLDAGRDVRAKDIIEGHSLTTAEELYDYLVWKRDENSD